jgi:protein-disulfide isomerase
MEDKSKRKKEDATKSGTGRTRTIERRKERQREQRRQRQIIAAVAVAVVAVIVVILIVVSNAPAEAPIPETALSNYAGLEFSRSPEGYPRLGNPNAPVQVVEYSSFDCSHCRDFHDTSFSGLLERVRAGDILFTYAPVYGTGSFQNGQGAANASVCAADQGGFFPFHDALFSWQGLYGNQAFTQARMGTGISSLGMDRGAFDSCLRSGSAEAVVDTAMNYAASVASFGTPYVLVNGVQVTADLPAINQAIDQGLALVGVTPGNALPTTEATAEATAEATREATVEATTSAETTPASEVTAEPTAESTP